MIVSLQRRSTPSKGNTQRPAVSRILALNFLGAWLLYLVSTNSGSLRNLNLDDIIAIDDKNILLTNDPVAENSRLQKRLAQRGVPPVSCSKVLRDARANATFSDPNQGKLFARFTSQDPHFYVSVHEKSYDLVRFNLFERHGTYYEMALTDAFRQVLTSNPNNSNKRVIDVGGNIGWYTLLSAEMGAQVATFEPHMPNYLRMCESQCLNDWLVSTNNRGKESSGSCLTGGDESTFMISKHIQIFPYAVSDVNAEFNFQQTQAGNPGAGRITKEKTNRSTRVRVVTLDDMVDSLGWGNQDIDILKVDVEGAEMGVFLGAKKLLKSNRVQNIFMEGNVRTRSEAAEFETLINLFVESGYHLYKIGGWSGPSSTDKVPKHDDNFARNLVVACRKHSSKQCNLWWKVSHADVKWKA